MNAEDRSAAAMDLRHAAERVRWAGSRAQPGPWFVRPDETTHVWTCIDTDSLTPEQGASTICSFATEQDVRWIANVAPHISVPLAQLFEEAAAWIEHDDDDRLRTVVQMALPLAWAILRIEPRITFSE